MRSSASSSSALSAGTARWRAATGPACSSEVSVAGLALRKAPDRWQPRPCPYPKRPLLGCTPGDAGPSLPRAPGPRSWKGQPLDLPECCLPCPALGTRTVVAGSQGMLTRPLTGPQATRGCPDSPRLMPDGPVPSGLCLCRLSSCPSHPHEGSAAVFQPPSHPASSRPLPGALHRLFQQPFHFSFWSSWGCSCVPPHCMSLFKNWGPKAQGRAGLANSPMVRLGGSRP